MKHKGIIITLSILIVVLAVGGWKFFDIYKYAKVHVPKNTTVNGVDCSDLSIAEAKKKLTDEWNSRAFVVKNGDKTLGTIKGIVFDYDIDKDLKKVTDIGAVKTVYRYIRGKKHSYNIDMKISETPEELTDAIGKFKFLDAKFKTKTKNAYVDLATREFKVVKEVYGDNIDKNRFIERVKGDIGKGDFELDYKAGDYYELPTLKSTDKKIADRKKWCEEHLSQVITYKFRDGDLSLTPKQLNDVLNFDEEDKKTVKEKELKSLVLKLAENHNTAYSTRTFKTHTGAKISITGGDYGWILNQKKERERLNKILLEGKDVTLDPIYIQKPYYTGDGSDIGNSYAEVDLGAQHLYFYKNGNLIVDCNVVSGKITDGHGTPSGVYKLDYKQRDTTLRGYNTDGTQYASPVSYWMPFNGGIGLHDAPWRKAFGGSIYYSGGSHGCVNMPVGAAATVFGQIEEGYPIVVYY